MPVRMSVAVVGAGLVGASCAYWLRRNGAEVTVLDHAGIGGLASGVAAGVMQPVTGRGARLAPWHEEGFRETLALLREVDPGGEVHRVPGVLRAALNESQAALWEKGASAMDDSIARWVDGDEARSLCGTLTEGCLGGIHVRDGVVVNMIWIAQRLIEASGARMLSGVRVLELARSGGLVTLLGTQGRSKWRGQYDRAVLATGTGTAELVERIGADELASKFVPARGEIADFRISQAPRMVVSSGGYVVPSSPDRIMVGGTFDERNPWAGVTAEGVADLEQRARRLLPEGTRLELICAWSGVRPATRDRVPRIGPVDDDQLVHVCTGHGAKGLLLGPISAKWLALAVTEQECDIPVRWRA